MIESSLILTGPGITWHYCTMSSAEYQRKRRRARRKEFLMLLGGKCEECGSTKNLHFDHIEPKKKEFHIARYINKPYEVVKKEVLKTRLLCEKCHRAKTKEHWDFALPPARHGTIWMYKDQKCRCDKCKKAMSDYYFNKK